MSLDLNYLFENKTILKENWLFQLFYDDESASDFFGVSYYDTTVQSVDYKGCVFNKATIRESIDLENSTAKTSNVSLSLANFIDADGTNFSRKLFGNTNKYINRKVKIFIQPDDTNDIDVCVLIYTGRLEQISHNQEKINLSIVAQRPWDKISIPNQNDKTTNNVHKPVTYGDYLDSGTDADHYPLFKAHPIKYCTEINRIQYYLTGQGANGTKGALFWDKYLQQYAGVDSSSSTVGQILGENSLQFPITSTRSTKFFLTSIKPSTETPGSDSGWVDTANLFKDTGFAYLPAPNQSIGTTTNKYLYINCPNFDGEATALTLKVDTQFYGTIGSANGFTLKFRWGDASSEWHSSAQNSYGTNDTENFSLDILSTYNSEGKNMMEYLTILCVFSGALHPNTHQIRVSNVRVEAVYKYPSDSYGKLDNTALEFLYSGGDGQISDIDESPITEIHEAHRDILHRYTSYASSNTPTNWSSGLNIDSVKDWKIRYSVLEPTPLIEVLEKLQYEGGFIGRFNGQGAYQYIFIPDSPSASVTLGKDDVSDINISLTPINGLTTKMDIEYEKHPAENKYLNTVASVSDTDSNLLSTYNIASDENVKRVTLDAYVSPTIPTGASSNKNDDFYSYYQSIVGEPRLIVDLTVVNPKYLGLDVGDLVAYNDTFLPFNGSTGWDDYVFMVTDVSRSVGSLKITLRDIENG